MCRESEEAVTQAQYDTLTVLSDGREHPMGRRNEGVFVSGVSTNALIRRGYARVQKDKHWCVTWVATITDEGRLALEVERKRRSLRAHHDGV